MPDGVTFSHQLKGNLIIGFATITQLIDRPGNKEIDAGEAFRDDSSRRVSHASYSSSQCLPQVRAAMVAVIRSPEWFLSVSLKLAAPPAQATQALLAVHVDEFVPIRINPDHSYITIVLSVTPPTAPLAFDPPCYGAHDCLHRNWNVNLGELLLQSSISV